MLYYADGRTTTAATPEHQAELIAAGWCIAPLAVHRQRPVTAHGILGARDPIAAKLREAIQEVLDDYDLSSWVEPEATPAKSREDRRRVG
jgi:hypothetical protein